MRLWQRFIITFSLGGVVNQYYYYLRSRRSSPFSKECWYLDVFRWSTHTHILGTYSELKAIYHKRYSPIPCLSLILSIPTRVVAHPQHLCAHELTRGSYMVHVCALCVCVCMCACVRVRACVWVHVCGCVWVRHNPIKRHSCWIMFK